MMEVNVVQRSNEMSSAPSFTTGIWGPPFWRLLHTLSFASDRAPKRQGDVSAVTAFMRALPHVLPCSFCRQSWAQFSAELERETRSGVAEHVSQRRLVAYLYAAHNKVNEKLDTQHAAQTGVPYVPSRGISLECLVRRFTVQPVQLCEKDVWLLLFILALNYPRDPADPRRGGSYRQLFAALPRVLALCGLGEDLGCAIRTQLQTAPAGFVRAFRTSDALFDWVLSLKLACAARQRKGTPDRRAMARDIRKVLRQAQAGVCAHGSCV